MKTFKTILIISAAILSAGFLFVSPTNATVVSPLIVEWSETGSNWLPLSGPIFSETNFLPGQDVMRLIRVTNYSGETQRIATEAINKNDPDNLASQMNLTIKEGATVIFNDTLAKFFSQGETYLSSLADGTSTQYDFTITFNLGAGNEDQAKTLGFDILVGFEGTEGGLPLPPPGGGTSGGGGGGILLSGGLTIQNEATVTITEVSVTISWLTSYPATSQVVYANEGEAHILDLTDSSGTPPKYGYEHTTPEYDVDPKVTSHSVTVFGLTPGTKYYYRTISHGSLAISQERSFNTLALGEGNGEQEVLTFGEKVTGGISNGEENDAGKISLSERISLSEEVSASGEKGAQEKTVEQTASPKNFASILLANIGIILDKISKPVFLIIILILLLILLLVISARFKNWKFFQRNKDKEK